ncbi:MAG: glycosyltransferase family 2 protein [Candidatus Bathyarchaeia archaeon]|jgi:cellulose synthase/poly-beta-1,6-N-acetylglucosamine synthase-like glycosyltransferase
MIAYDLFLLLGIVAVLAATYAYYLGMKFDDNVSLSLRKPRLGFTPKTCIVMACKGDEPELEKNVEAILNQDYSNYRTIIVTDKAEDPASFIVKSILTRHAGEDIHLYDSDDHPRASGKVAALLTAIEKDAGTSEAFAFVDSDASVSRLWLADLVAPLASDSVGATTGFRWYFPSRGGFWSHVESAWNASGMNLMFNERYNFPWGGAMAIRTEKLNSVDIQSVWEHAISDDLSLNSALRKHDYRIIFVPQCTVATHNRATARSFFNWATRQITFTRVFNPELWRYGFAAYAFFSILLILALAGLAAAVLWSPTWLIPSALLFTPSILGILRSSQRITTFKRAMPAHAQEFEKNRIVDSMTSLIVPWVMTYCIVKSVRMTEIEWRGRNYKLTG